MTLHRGNERSDKDRRSDAVPSCRRHEHVRDDTIFISRDPSDDTIYKGELIK